MISTKSQRRSVVILSIGVVCVLTVAVSASASIEGSAGPAAATASVPQQLLGRWTRNVTRADGAGTAEVAPGVWTLEFRRDGMAYAYKSGGPRYWAGFSATTRGRLVFGSAGHCRQGRYLWMVSGRLLTIGVVRDQTCPARPVINVGTWLRR